MVQHKLADALEARTAHRRRLTLSVEANVTAAGTPVDARLLDLSERGFLLESDTALDEGDVVDIGLPETAAATEAVVVWTAGTRHGCEFVTPISRATVSALLLRSPALHGQVTIPADQQSQEVFSPGAKLAIWIGLALLAWLPIIVAFSLWG